MKSKRISLFSLITVLAVTVLIPANAESPHSWEIERIDDRLNDTYRCIARLRKDGPRPQLYADGSIWFGGMGNLLAYQIRYNDSPAHGTKGADEKWIKLTASKWQNDERIRMTVLPRYRSGSYFFDIDVAPALEALSAVKQCRPPYEIDSSARTACRESLPKGWTQESCAKFAEMCELTKKQRTDCR